jgi:hypothetical protein
VSDSRPSSASRLDLGDGMGHAGCHSFVIDLPGARGSEESAENLDPAMARPRISRHFEPAFTVIEVLLTAGLFVLLLAAVVVGFGSAAHTARAAAYNEAGKAAAQAVVDALSRDCASAIACFTPANDVGNHSNTDGHEVAFYTRDAHGVGKFWSYCYKAKSSSNCAGTPAANTVTLYGPYAWTALPQNGGAGVPSIGAIASNITSFATSTITASQLVNNTKNPLTAGIFVQAGYTSIVNVQRQTGYPGVLAGNNVTIVRLATQGLTREVHLLAGVRPTHVTTVIGQITPPPNTLTTIGSGTNYAWTNPLGAAVGFGVAENNYGTRTTTPPQIYTSSSNNCTSGLQGTATATLTPVTNGTGDAPFTLAPQIKTEPSGVSCQIVYVDNMGQAATFHFTIGQTYAPGAAAGAGSYYNTDTIVFTVSEQNYEPPAAGGGYTAATSGACGAPSLASDSFSGGTYNVVYNVLGSGQHGTCTLTITDAYGQQASANTQVIARQAVCSTNPVAGTTVNDVEYDATNAEPPCAAPLYAITVTPQTVFDNVNPGSWVYWTGVANITNAAQSPGSPLYSPVTIANGQGNCPWSNPGWISPGGGSFGGAPNAYSISCSAQVVDQNNDAPVTVTINAATPAPTSAPTCPPGYTGTYPYCSPGGPSASPHKLVSLGCAYVEQHDVNLNVYEDNQACQGVFADGTLGPAINYGADMAYVNFYGGFLCGTGFTAVGDGPVGVWINEGQPTSYPGTDANEISAFQTLSNALAAAWAGEPSGQKDGFTSSYEVLYCPS